MVAGLVGGVGDGEDLALGAGEAVAALLHAGYVHIVNRWHSSSSQYLVYKLTNNILIKYSLVTVVVSTFKGARIKTVILINQTLQSLKKVEPQGY